MKDYFENQLSRAQKVEEFLTVKSHDLVATPEIANTLLPQLHAAIIKTQADDAKATEDDTGYAAQKEDIRTQLEEAIFHVSTGLVSYADDNDDFVMMNMFDFTFSALQSFRETRLAQFAKDVYDKATANPPNADLASSHNVSAADLTLLRTLTTQFNDAVAKPRQHIAEKSAYTKQVARDISSLNDIAKRIATKMAVYRSSNRLLFDAFEACYAIDDTGAQRQHTFTGNIGTDLSEKITDITYAADERIELQNTGSVELRFSLRDAADLTIGAPISVLGGGNYIKRPKYSDFGPGGTALHVYNAGNTGCTYIVTVP